MEDDITDVIANLILQADPELETRLESQEEALQTTLCLEPTIGRWIDNTDVNYLLAALELNQKDFSKAFPEFAHLLPRQRQRCIILIEQHFELCAHCSLKRAYDLELDARIERICGIRNSSGADNSEAGDSQFGESLPRALTG
jgi:hypothetical protein